MMTRITGPMWGFEMARRIVFSFLALLCAVAPALAQSSAGSGAGGGSSGGGGPATQSGAWNVGITGTLPAFAATPTFNVGTIAGIATDSSVQAVKTALGSPFQAGGSIANTAFGISGTLPAFAATPTVNLGTLNGAATAAAQATGNGSLASIDGKTPALGTLTKAGSRSVTPASDLANIEPAGAAISGAAMPSGGVGVTGWLSSIWSGTINRSSLFADVSNAAVAANGFTADSRHPVGSAPIPWTRFNAVFSSTQAGTYFLQGSNDNFTSTFNVSTGALAANAVVSMSVPVVFTSYRVFIGNGATAATVNIASSFTVN